MFLFYKINKQLDNLTNNHNFKFTKLLFNCEIIIFKTYYFERRNNLTLNL